MKRGIRVVAALIESPDRPGAFLVQQRLPGNEPRALLWELPGGKVEPGETCEAALARECREELAVSVEVGPRLWSTVHEYADLVVELVLHRAHLGEGGAPRPLGAHALLWCTPVEMKALPFCEADLPLVAELAAGRIR